ncbi:MAG: helix-turn-helix domain-containing protein [Pseudomonadota bacterium]
MLGQWRKSKGYTQGAFAKLIGTSAAYISQIESGHRRPSIELAKRIEKATRGRVPAAILMGLDTSKAVRETATSFETDRRLSEEARALGLDPEAIAAKAIEASVKRKRFDAWLDENADAFVANAKEIEDSGLWSDRRRLF